MKVTIFTLKTSSVQLPTCCVSCLGPADAVYPLTGYNISKGRERDGREIKYKNTTSLYLPYCNSCARLAKQKYPLEKTMNVLKYVQIPVSLTLMCLFVALLARILPKQLEQQWYCFLPEIILFVGAPIGLYVLFRFIGAHSVSPQDQEARARAEVPAAFYEPPWGNEYTLYFKNKRWADLFGKANNIVGQEVELER